MVAADFDAYSAAQRAVDARWHDESRGGVPPSSTRPAWASFHRTARSQNMRPTSGECRCVRRGETHAEERRGRRVEGRSGRRGGHPLGPPWRSLRRPRPARHSGWPGDPGLRTRRRYGAGRYLGRKALLTLERTHQDGFFEGKVKRLKGRFSYRLRCANQGGAWEFSDPYAFGPVLGPMDDYLLVEGTHWRLYERLGAHLRTIDGVDGVNFAVWAPDATSVSVVGDFNAWDGRRHPMRKRLGTGLWETLPAPVREPGRGSTSTRSSAPAAKTFSRSRPTPSRSPCELRSARFRRGRAGASAPFHWQRRRAHGGPRRRGCRARRAHVASTRCISGSWRRGGGATAS